MKDFEIRCDETRIENNNTLYGKFSLGPFLSGQGTTFGNALRRSLLSELSGLAITAFEIVGVMQEFSTLPGLRESVLDLSLNLKQVVLTGVLPCSIPPVGFLKVRGPAIIKATDLKLPAGVYCASPQQYIATLASNGILNLKFVVSVGKGHSTQTYALYRSLSKIKLEPTFYSNFGENEKHNESISLSDTSVYNSQSLRKNGKNLQGLDGKVLNSLNKTPKTSIENYVAEMDSSTLSYSKNISHNQPTFNSTNANTGVSSHNSLNNVNLRNSTGVNTYLSSSKISSLSNSTNANTGVSSEYVSVQKQIFQRVHPHQVLPIDAVFTPISKVNFSTQVNDRFETSRENIVLEIWTNGSIHPKRALEEATLSLVQNFQALLQNIQQASSFYKGLRYWDYLQPLGNYDEIVNFPPIVNQDSQGSYEGEKDNARKTIEEMSERNSGSNQRLLKKNVFMPVKTQANYQTNTNYSLPLHQAVYNLDIGNLNLSLETFIQLKKAKIHTLSQLLTNLSSKKKDVFLNKKVVKELNNVVNRLGINL